MNDVLLILLGVGAGGVISTELIHYSVYGRPIDRATAAYLESLLPEARRNSLSPQMISLRDGYISSSPAAFSTKWHFSFGPMLEFTVTVPRWHRLHKRLNALHQRECSRSEYVKAALGRNLW